MFELIINVLLEIFFIYTLCFHVLEAPVPEKVARNPYTLQPDAWPKAILYLLIFCTLINIIRIIIKNKKNPDFSLATFGKGAAAFFKSKLFLGMAIVFILSFLLEPLGFKVTISLFLIAYAILLGWRKYAILVPICVGIALFLYICFGVLLQVNLPRGTVPFLRDFALWLESLFRWI